jgi:regulator of sigma E protease
MAGNVLVVIVVFAVLIFIHELGHLLACKLSRIKVEKFSLGFGPALVKWKAAETTYMISAVPLGGYIKMEGEDYGSTGFFNEPLGKKVAVLVTGPGFNLLLGFVLIALLFGVFGMRVPEPRIVPVAGSPAALAGLQKGDLVLTLNGDTVRSFIGLDSMLLKPESSALEFRVRRGGEVRGITVYGVPESLGLDPFYEPRLGTVRSGGPGAKAGLKSGDLILSVDSVAIGDWGQFIEIVRASPNQAMQFRCVRGGDTLSRTVTPRLGTDLATGEKVGQIGAELATRRVLIPAHQAIWEALKRTGQVVVKTFVILYQLVTGQISARAVGGPVMVAKIAYEGAQWGGEMLLALWAMLSINLFVINMLPVPFLDGGRAVLFIYEGIRRRKLTARQWDIALRFGLHLVVLLVIFALSNDFLNIVNLAPASGSLTRKIQLGLVAAYAVFMVFDLVRTPRPAKTDGTGAPSSGSSSAEPPASGAGGR